MGSDSDLYIMKEAAKILDMFSISNEIKVISAHRTTERMVNYANEAKRRGIMVIIAGAGGAAHLPGMVASLTSIPVIGVPIKTASLQGMDSLMSIVQMPAGVPVATVAINGAKKDRKSTRLNSSHANISYAVFCLKKKKSIIYSTL